MSKRRKKRKSADQRRGAEFTLTSLTPEEQKQIRVEFAKRSEQQKVFFDKAFPELQAEMLELDPVFFLAYFGWRMFVPAGETPESQRNAVGQHEIELFQALALKNPLEAYNLGPVALDRMEAFRDKLSEVSQAFTARLWASVAEAGDERTARAELTLLNIRENTQKARNWGYLTQVKRIVADLFAPLDASLSEQTGVNVAGLISMLETVFTRIEDKINEFQLAATSVARAKDVPAILSLYREYTNWEPSEADQIVERLTQEKPPLEHVRWVTLNHLSRGLVEKFLVTEEDFVAAYGSGVDISALRRVLDGWSLSFSELSEQQAEHFYMNNPVWSKPFIKLEEGSYFWPNLALMHSNLFLLAETLVLQQPTLRDRYSNRRAQFLETSLEALFRKAFPTATILFDVRWVYPADGKQYQTDLLVEIDETVIVVEAKSGRVAESARRGGRDRLRRVVQDLMIDPSVQSQRYVDYLRGQAADVQMTDAHGTQHVLRDINNKTFIRLNVTLEPIGFLHTDWPSLKEAGFVPPETQLAPTLTLADLETVFDTLEGQSQKFHYLLRRASFEADVDYVGDEMDLLAYYLETGFNNLPTPDGTPPHLHILGFSQDIDKYQMWKDTPYGKAKPQLKLTKWWRAILAKAEAKGVPFWTRITTAMLDVPIAQQVGFEQHFNRVKKRTRRQKEPLDQRNTLVHVAGPRERRDAITAFAYKGVDKEARDEFALDVGTHAMAETGCQGAVVIGVDVDEEAKHYPYSVLFFCKEPDGS